MGVPHGVAKRELLGKPQVRQSESCVAFFLLARGFLGVGAFVFGGILAG